MNLEALRRTVAAQMQQQQQQQQQRQRQGGPAPLPRAQPSPLLLSLLIPGSAHLRCGWWCTGLLLYAAAVASWQAGAGWFIHLIAPGIFHAQQLHSR